MKNRAREVELEISADFLEHLDEGDSKAATLPDGSRLGKVTKVRGRQTAAVVDEREFLTWVQTRYPTEIEPTVRPAFREKLLSSAKTHGLAVDETTGEVIPGIELTTGEPYISFRSERGSQELIAAHWHEIAGPALLAPEVD